jgi:hypothetical protein
MKARNATKVIDMANSKRITAALVLTTFAVTGCVTAPGRTITTTKEVAPGVTVTTTETVKTKEQDRADEAYAQT